MKKRLLFFWGDASGFLDRGEPFCITERLAHYIHGN
jgi:hypothetical protein